MPTPTVTGPDMPSEIKQLLLTGLEDSDYRRIFAAEQLNTGLAYQLRLLREDRGWTQEELARRTGKSQEMISRWEDPDYGSYSISTLKAFADAFDVSLIVKFAPFSELTKWLTSLSKEQLVPKGFEEDRKTTTSTASVVGTMDARLQIHSGWEHLAIADVHSGYLQNVVVQASPYITIASPYFVTSIIPPPTDVGRPYRESKRREKTLMSDLSLTA